MAIGEGAKVGVDSYVAFGNETTFGTYDTSTTQSEALSVSFKAEINKEKIESLHINRGHIKRKQLDKTVGGTMEEYLHPEQSVLLLTNGLAGTLTSNSLTSAADHSITAGNFAGTYSSLNFNVRKGDTHVFEYSGGRVNQMVISANVGELVKVSYDFIFRDNTLTTNDISAALSVSAVCPFTYVEGVFRYSDTEANAATTTAEEKIMGFELTVNNNLKPEEGRELGSRVLGVLPATRRDVELKITQRFDTSTTFNRFLQATEGAAELKFVGESITAEYNYEMTIRMPKVFLNSPEPEVGGPDEVLSSELIYDVIVDDPNTSTGRDIGVTVRNATSGY